MPQCTLVKVLRLPLAPGMQVRYGPGQYVMGYDPFAMACMKDGQHDPPGVPFDNPGPEPVTGPPERSTWRWPDAVP
jgi:hypothetical protein